MEINLQLPNGYSKMLKIGNEGDAGGVKSERDVVIVRRDGDARLLDKIENSDGKKKVFVMKKGEGEPMVFNSEGATADGKHKFVIKKGDGNVEEITTTEGNKIMLIKTLSLKASRSS